MASFALMVWDGDAVASTFAKHLVVLAVAAACGGQVADSIGTTAAGGTSSDSPAPAEVSTSSPDATGSSIPPSPEDDDIVPPTDSAIPPEDEEPAPDPDPAGSVEPAPDDGPDLSRFMPYICFDACRTFADCPSPRPYVADCGIQAKSCLLRCDAGCPPGLLALEINGGCLCYHPDVTASHGDSECCSSGDCGAPYYVPCCEGRCVDGTCQ